MIRRPVVDRAVQRSLAGRLPGSCQGGAIATRRGSGVPRPHYRNSTGAQRTARMGTAGRGLLPRPVRVVTAWAVALLLLGGASYLAVRALAAISFVLVPCLGAVLLAALLKPVDRWLQRLRLHRGWSAGVTVLLCLVAVVGIGTVVVYVLASRFDQLADQFRSSLQQLRGYLAHAGLPIGPDVLDQLERQVQKKLQHAGSTVASTGMMIAGAAFRAVAQLLLGLFVLFFLIYDGERIWRWLSGKVPARARPRVRAAGEAAWVTLSGYVHGTLIIAVVHGVVIGLALFLLGVPVFLPLGLLVFLGSFIPVVGALVAGGLSVLITLGTQGLIPAVILLAVLLLENELESHVLQPFVVGRFVRLHPLAIVLVLALGAWLGGIVGALIAVPAAGIASNAWRPLTGRPSVIEEPRRRTWLGRWILAGRRMGSRLWAAAPGRHQPE